MHQAMRLLIALILLLPILKKQIEKLYLTMYVRPHLLAQEKASKRSRLVREEQLRGIFCSSIG